MGEGEPGVHILGPLGLASVLISSGLFSFFADRVTR